MARIVIAVATIGWGFFQAIAAVASGWFVLLLTRLGLGATEAPIYPAGGRSGRGDGARDRSPVYDSVAVTLWKCLRATGVGPGGLRNWGRLFGLLPEKHALAG